MWNDQINLPMQIDLVLDCWIFIDFERRSNNGKPALTIIPYRIDAFYKATFIEAAMYRWYPS